MDVSQRPIDSVTRPGSIVRSATADDHPAIAELKHEGLEKSSLTGTSARAMRELQKLCIFTETYFPVVGGGETAKPGFN